MGSHSHLAKKAFIGHLQDLESQPVATDASNKFVNWLTLPWIFPIKKKDSVNNGYQQVIIMYLSDYDFAQMVMKIFVINNNDSLEMKAISYKLITSSKCA